MAVDRGFRNSTVMPKPFLISDDLQVDLLGSGGNHRGEHAAMDEEPNKSTNPAHIPRRNARQSPIARTLAAVFSEAEDNILANLIELDVATA